MGKWGVVWVLELYSSVEGINFRLNGELLIKKIRCEKKYHCSLLHKSVSLEVFGC